MSLKIADAHNITCQVVISVPPPATCSEPDCEILATVLDVSCNDNNTATDPSDDTFFVQVDINVANSDESVAWIATTTDGRALENGLFPATAVFDHFTELLSFLLPSFQWHLASTLFQIFHAVVVLSHAILHYFIYQTICL